MINLIWKYLVGPIVADAKGLEQATWNGVAASTGYNPVNTLAYVLLAGSILYIIHRYFEKKDIKLRPSTAVYSTPFILLGGFLRFMDDAQVIPYPYSIALITPVIYILIASIYVPALTKLNEKNILKLGTALLTPTILLTFLSFKTTNPWYAVTVITLSTTLTALYYFIISEKYTGTPFMILAFSQLFEGTASMFGAVPQLLTKSTTPYYPKQLLAQTFNKIIGFPGVLLMKIGVLIIGISVIKDLEDSNLKFLAFLLLYAVGLGTGLRVFLRVTAGV
jgi:uncharacterized membrane protein